MSINKTILEKSKEAFSLMQSIRRVIHMHPELGMEEFNTNRIIIQHLDSMEIPYKNKVANTGVVGLIEGASPGRVIALRADMDALPVQEETDAQYASKIDGVMHACGHDAHVAMVIGAASVLKDLKDQIKGSVKLIFQPAEEGPGGAEPMIAQGALEDPPVDAILGFHVSSNSETGKVGINMGATHAAQNTFTITVTGKGGHAAQPHNCIDALLMSCEAVAGFQKIISRFNDPLEPAVITVGTIEGGYRTNIIAEKVTMTGTIRYLKESTGDLIKSSMGKVLESTVRSYGGDYTLVFEKGYPAAFNDETLANQVYNSIENLLGSEMLYKINKPTMGAEDFAYYGEKIPSVFMRLGTQGKNKEFAHPHHSGRFDIDETAMIQGCAAFVKAALDYLSSD